MAKRKFTEDEVYELEQAYNADYLDVPAYKQRTFREIIEREARGEEDKKATGKNYKEEMDREIAAKRSPLFREEQEFYKKQEQQKKKAENPKPSVVAPTTPTNTQKEPDMEEYDPLAEEDIYDDTTIVEPSAKANPATSFDDTIKMLQADPSYKAATAYLESLGFEKERHADIIAKNPSLVMPSGVAKDLDIAPISPKEEGTPPTPQTEEVLDPYSRYRKALQEEQKSWRQLLIENYNKRQAEQKKRIRNAQIVGLGKALGDLLGAAFAGAGASKGGYRAIVPQAQAPKSVERVQQLINEGIVSAKDYDSMMLNLAMQEGRDKVAMAKAMDELDIKKQQDALDHKQRLEVIAAQGQKQQAIETLKGTIRAAAAAQKAKDQKTLETLKGEIRKQVKAVGGVSALYGDYFSLALLNEIAPEELEYSTTTETTKDTPVGKETTTRTVSGTKKVPRTKAQIEMSQKEAKRLANAWGLSKEQWRKYNQDLLQLRKENGYTDAQMKGIVEDLRTNGIIN